MASYTYKPTVQVEAILYTGTAASADAVGSMFSGASFTAPVTVTRQGPDSVTDPVSLKIETPHLGSATPAASEVMVPANHYIVVGIDREIFTMDAATFTATFDAV